MSCRQEDGVKTGSTAYHGHCNGTHGKGKKLFKNEPDEKTEDRQRKEEADERIGSLYVVVRVILDYNELGKGTLG